MRIPNFFLILILSTAKFGFSQSSYSQLNLEERACTASKIYSMSFPRRRTGDSAFRSLRKGVVVGVIEIWSFPRASDPDTLSSTG